MLTEKLWLQLTLAAAISDERVKGTISCERIAPF